MLLSRSGKGSYADTLTLWPQIKEDYPIPILKMDDTGHRLAVGQAGRVQVWTIGKIGSVEKLIWQSNQDKFFVFDFAWWGSNLVVSAVANNTHKNISDLTDEEEEAFLRTRGSTLCIDLDGKKIKSLFATAYYTLSISPSSHYLAAATPTHTESRSAVLDFYELNSQSKSGRQTAHFTQSSWGPIRNDVPYLIGWNAGSDGVFVVGANGANIVSNEYRRVLFFVSQHGNAREVLPQSTSIIPADKLDLPMTSWLQNGTLSLYVDFYHQAQAQIAVDLNGVQQNTSWNLVWSLVKDVVNTAQIIAVSPNGRILILQDVGKGKYPTGDSQRYIWAVDVKTRRRRKLAKSGVIKTAYQWFGPNLILRIERKKSGNDKSSLNFGFLHVEEACLPPLLLDSKEANAPWELTTHSHTLEPASAEAAKMFLNQAAIAPISLSGSLTTGQIRPRRAEGLDIYRIGGFTDANSLIAVESKSNRVVEFKAPPPVPPLPTQVIGAERAQAIALQFARSYQAALFDPSGKVITEISPDLSRDGNYVIHLQRIEQDVQVPSWIRIEVRASDGKVAGYEEHLDPVRVALASTLTVDNAHEAIRVNLAKQVPPQKLVQWLEASHEIRTLDGTQRNIWTIVAEVQGKNRPVTFQSELESLREWQIDANTGAVVSTTTLAVTFDRYEWYRTHGGTHLPHQGSLTQILIADRAPHWSPTGGQVAFLSNRPHAGCPAWWLGRPEGLFIVNADGSHMECVAPQVTRNALWSPDGEAIAYQSGSMTQVYSVKTRKTTAVPANKDALVTQIPLGWIGNDQLLLGWIHNGPGACDLVTWSLTQPEHSPRVLAQDFSDNVGNEDGAGSFLVSPDGKTLYFTWRSQEAVSLTSSCQYSLYSVLLDSLAKAPLKLSKIVGCLPNGEYMQMLGANLLLTGNDQATLVNLSSNQAQDWKQPDSLWQLRGTPSMDNIEPSFDGSHIAFTALSPMSQTQGYGIVALYLSSGDGTNASPLP